jgi:sulfate permease, SulP family
MLMLHENADVTTWLPKSVVCLRYYDRFRSRSDLAAAMILAFQVFPVGIAIATASGVCPLYGIFCAATAGLLASGLGDSKIRVSAPNIVFVAVASSIVGREGVLGLSVSTLFAGVLLIFLGSVRLGTAISMVPRPVVLGFSTVLVVSGLLFNLLGTRSQILAHEIRERAMTVPQIMAIDPKAIALATGTLILTMGGRRVFRFQYVPGGLIAIVMGALLVRFWHFPARTIEQSCASTLMSLHLYLTGLLRLDLLGSVLAQAFAIAILVAMESLHAMGHAATLTGERLNPNRELLVHGGVNIACSVVGGLPASGVCVYTSTNARTGAQTPVAGMLHAVFLLALMLLMAPLVPCVLITTT